MKWAVAPALLMVSCGGRFQVFEPPPAAAGAGCPALELSVVDLPNPSVGTIELNGLPQIVQSDGAMLEIGAELDATNLDYSLLDRFDDCLGCSVDLVAQVGTPETWISVRGFGLLRGRLDDDGAWPVARLLGTDAIDIAIASPNTAIVAIQNARESFVDFRGDPPVVASLDLDAVRLARAEDHIYAVTWRGELLRVAPDGSDAELVEVEAMISSVASTSDGQIVAGTASGELVWVAGLQATVDPASQLTRAWAFPECPSTHRGVLDVAEACGRIVYATCGAVATMTPEHGHRCAPLKMPGTATPRRPVRVEAIDCDTFVITGWPEARVLRFGRG